MNRTFWRIEPAVVQQPGRFRTTWMPQVGAYLTAGYQVTMDRDGAVWVLRRHDR